MREEKEEEEEEEEEEGREEEEEERKKRSKGRLQDGTQNGQNKERRLTTEEHVGDHKTRASGSVNEETSMRQKLFASLTTSRPLRTGKGVKGREGYGEVAADIHSPKSESDAGPRAARVKRIVLSGTAVSGNHLRAAFGGGSKDGSVNAAKLQRRGRCSSRS